MLPSQSFINTEVVDIQGFNVGEDVVVQMLLEDTECVSKQTVVLVYGYKDPPLLVFESHPELIVRIFSLPVFNEVRAPFMMDHCHLGEQFVDPVNIFF